jgi:hypothetical protein
MSMKPRWNDNDRTKPKNSEINLSQCHFVHNKSHVTDLDAKPNLRSERTATNRLSYGTAMINILKTLKIVRTRLVY